MSAYGGNEDLKIFYIERARAHRKAGEILQGLGWDGAGGCCIGCLAHAYPAHKALASDIGVDEGILHLADAIHEELPVDLAETWPERFCSSIPVGVDLYSARWRFLHWLLTDRSVNPGREHEAVREAVQTVADLCMSAAATVTSPKSRWSAAAAAAAAAGAVAWAAEATATASAAWLAGRTLAASAHSAASAALAAESVWRPESVARSVEAAVRSATLLTQPTWVRVSEELLKFLSESADNGL